jgi:glycolate oxidase iron-sulfur subunit
VVATGAQVVATANVGCALQLQAAARLYGRRLRVAHVVELLHQTYRATPNEDSSLTNA